MKHKKKTSAKKKATLAYLFGALLPTLVMFMTHDLWSGYEMNVLDFLLCSIPAIAGLPILCCTTDDCWK